MTDRRVYDGAAWARIHEASDRFAGACAAQHQGRTAHTQALRAGVDDQLAWQQALQAWRQARQALLDALGAVMVVHP